MATYHTQRSVARRMALPLAIQNTVGENMVDADFVRGQLFETSGFFVRKPMLESDYDFAGKGHGFGSDDRLIGWQSNGEIMTRADHWIAGWMLANCMGVDTFTAGPPNSHVITWLDTPDPAPLSNVYIEDTAGVKRRWLDQACSQVVMTCSKIGAVTVKGTFMGSGQVADGALAAVPAYEVKPAFLYAQDAVLSIGPTGAPVSKVPRVRSWEATWDHQIEEVRMPGTGLYAAFLRMGRPMMKLKIVVDADETTDIRGWMEAQTELEVKVVITSTGTTLTLDWPRVVLPGADMGEQDKYVAYTLDLDEKSIMKPNGGEPFTATLLNLEAAYLVGAA